jgi:hypothetical protein
MFRVLVRGGRLAEGVVRYVCLGGSATGRPAELSVNDHVSMRRVDRCLWCRAEPGDAADRVTAR